MTDAGRVVARCALGIAWCLAGSACAPGAATDAVLRAPGPHALLRESGKNFGSVEPGTLVTERFEIANVGDHPLDILSLAPSCRCTATPVADRTIWPDRVGAIEVTFDTTGLSGRQVKTVRLHTNDPGVAEIELTLHGEVARDVRVKPDRVWLGRLAPGEVSASVVEVTLLRPEVTVTGVSSAAGQLDVTVAALDGPERGVRLTVVPRTNGEPGRFNDSIIVATNSPRQPRVTIPVLASIESRGGRRSAR